MQNSSDDLAKDGQLQVLWVVTRRRLESLAQHRFENRKYQVGADLWDMEETRNTYF